MTENPSSAKNKPDEKIGGNSISSRIMQLLNSMVSRDRSVFTNSLFLIGTTIGNSGLGFLFWIVAARKYSTAEVGIGAAFINSVSLIALLADMGMGITLLRFIAGFGDRRRDFINTSILLEAFISLIMSILFVLGTPMWSKDVQGLSSNLIFAVVFIGCCVFFLLANFLDNIFLAYNKAYLLFIRNMLANILRLLFLFFVPFESGAINFLLAVGIGAILTLGLSLFFLLPRTVPGYSLRFIFFPGLLQGRINYALSNQVIQLVMALAPLLFPLIIIKILGPEANAQFYICWMIANLLFVVPVSVATSTFVKIAGEPDQDIKILWRLLGLTLLGLAVVIPIFILISPVVLGLFGERYRQVSGILNWFLLSALPYAVVLFVITYFRLRSKLSYLMIVAIIPALLSLAAMVIGGQLGKLDGVGIGWLIAQVVGAIWVVFWLKKRTRNEKHL